MNVLKEILERDLDRINKAEKRDGKPHFNSQFLKNHIWLCISMVLLCITRCVINLFTLLWCYLTRAFYSDVFSYGWYLVI